LVAVNNIPVVALAGRAHAASSWPRDSLPVSLDIKFMIAMDICIKIRPANHTSQWFILCYKSYGKQLPTVKISTHKNQQVNVATSNHEELLAG